MMSDKLNKTLSTFKGLKNKTVVKREPEDTCTP